MAYLLGETIRHYQEEGALDGLIHYFIINESIEWNESYEERANHILSQHSWRFSGEYALINERGEVSEYADMLKQAEEVADCKFIHVYEDDLPGVVLAADIANVGQVLLMSYDGLETTDGVCFKRLYDREQ